ncbi:MAG: pyruvate, phosphate dikinase, partial [bacterium]|nr:pyruvate, phosphate dikinase [bacterium]
MTARKKAASSRRSARKKAASSQRSARKKTTARKRVVSRKVFFFGEGKADGRAEMKDLLGGKGANLAEMSRLGVPVPPGFTISTAVCAEYNRGRGRLPADVRKTSLAALSKLEKGMGQKFGDAAAPLLLSVRSGARASMPGMMDTVLNLGLNDATVRGLAAAADERFAYDTYRRFVRMYGDVVLEIPHDRFEDRLE